MKLLHVDSSILGTNSASRELSALIVARLSARPGTEVVYRDLAAEDLPHMTLSNLPQAHPLSAAAGPLDGAQPAARSASDDVLDEFLAAETVVIGAPMYNFTIPSQLKAWIDRILVPGKTFRYGAAGPEGLAGDKRVIVAMARGGVYGPDTGQNSAEHAERYLRTALGFIGIGDPEVVVAEGLAGGDRAKGDGVASARAAVHQLAA